MIVTPGHCRLLNYCTLGIKATCQRHNINYRRLFKEGIPVDELRDIDDAFIQRLVKLVEQETK